MGVSGSGHDLAEVVRRFGPDYLARHRVCQRQRRTLTAIAACRTAALGGHLEICDQCGLQRAVYHSCRNRHCPKCQRLAKQRWIEARLSELLPIPYFHVVFTLPHEINGLAQTYPRLVYGLLFAAAAQTPLAFGADPKHLGGQIGITAILHTWGQNLSQHIHLHCVVTGGGLSRDGGRWISGRNGYLFPVRALSRVFRGKYLGALPRAAHSGELATSEDLAALIKTLARKEWLVYAKPPFAGPQQVLRYLGRYTHRIAISDERIVEVEAAGIGFRWRDYRHGNRARRMTLVPEEFLRRFLLHVVPSGFVRVRYYGLLANRGRGKRLAQCRALLGESSSADTTQLPSDVRSLVLRLTGTDIAVCPRCGRGHMTIGRASLPGSRGPP